MANIRIARRSGLVLRGGRNIRNTLWAGVAPVSTVFAAANNAALTNVTGAGLLAIRPFTVMRMRGFMHVRSDQTGSLESYQVAWSASVVSDQAAAIGITALPTPFTDIDSDLFFMYQVVAGVFLFISGTGFDPIGGSSAVVESKAMRRVEDGSQIVFTLENSGLSAGSSTFSTARLLLKLH